MGELFQPMHLLIVLGIAFLVFGGRKLPELGKGLGEGIKGFKDGIKGATEPSKDEPPTIKPDGVSNSTQVK
ncbi:MAG TPA: twin-arginine translocase TatA/TatE family subunit [Acidobacteriaceae bacterium]|jgi:sec-independent protein translocase protein TatA|nr:twin-arginine translocase TatA/TatE family subunit [Acidobacteriaceae bacterium]